MGIKLDITVETPLSDDDRDILASVSLFEFLTYTIRLSANFLGLWREVASGHHYDLTTREITGVSVPRVGRLITWRG